VTAEDPHRRSSPRLWDTDWLILRALSKAVERAIAENICRSERLLDFGCGSMPYRSAVERLGAEYLGADFGGGMLQISPEGSIPVADRSVDAVLSVQVLEHVRDLDRYLGEASRVLKDDGVLLLSTHGTWLFHPHPEDHRRWTRTGLVVDVEARGFAVENIVGLVGPLATTTMIRLTGYAYFVRRLPVVGRLVAGAFAVVMNLRGLIEDYLTPFNLIQDNGCIYMIRCRKAGT
jgi:SAM-dependent methyltransferase